MNKIVLFFIALVVLIVGVLYASREEVGSVSQVDFSKHKHIEASTSVKKYDESISKSSAAEKYQNEESKNNRSIYEEIEKLKKSGTPASAFEAYRIISACLSAREGAVEIAQATDESQKAAYAQFPTPDQACGDISPGQIVSRLQLLETAAAAGVHGAAYAMALEGSSGDAANAPIDPAAGERSRALRQMIERGAQTGDKWSLMTLSNIHENGDPLTGKADFSKALLYWVAMNEIERMNGGKDSPRFDAIVTRLKNRLSQEEFDLAIMEGKKIAIENGGRK